MTRQHQFSSATCTKTVNDISWTPCHVPAGVPRYKRLTPPTGTCYSSCSTVIHHTAEGQPNQQVLLLTCGCLVMHMMPVSHRCSFGSSATPAHGLQLLHCRSHFSNCNTIQTHLRMPGGAHDACLPQVQLRLNHSRCSFSHTCCTVVSKHSICNTIPTHLRVPGDAHDARLPQVQLWLIRNRHSFSTL
jgi:hypothetical protein